jgi:dTDP-4-amino-4,6-dideoxygalactose transaminase
MLRQTALSAFAATNSGDITHNHGGIEETLNIDKRLIEAVITPRMRAIVVVQYADMPREMGTILKIARRHEPTVVEDAARGVTETNKNRTFSAIDNIGACIL